MNLSHNTKYFGYKAKLPCRLIQLVEGPNNVNVVFGVVKCHRSPYASMANKLGSLAEQISPTRQLKTPNPIAVMHGKEHGVPLHHAIKVGLIEKIARKESPQKA